MGKKFNVSVAFTIPNTLKQFIKTDKIQNTIEKLSCCDVVHKINCDASYVG